MGSFGSIVFLLSFVQGYGFFLYSLFFRVVILLCCDNLDIDVFRQDEYVNWTTAFDAMGI